MVFNLPSTKPGYKVVFYVVDRARIETYAQPSQKVIGFVGIQHTVGP